MRCCTRITRSPTTPAQMALFNTIHGSKLCSDPGVNHSNGKDKKRNGSGCLWPIPSASAQLNHCKIACRTNVIPAAAKTGRPASHKDSCLRFVRLVHWVATSTLSASTSKISLSSRIAGILREWARIRIEFQLVFHLGTLCGTGLVPLVVVAKRNSSDVET